MLIYFVSQNDSETNDDVAILAASQGNSGVPVQLNIASLGVEAKIEPVGLTAQGAMDIPSGPDTVAWFERGPRPGDSGSAVFAGHNVWQDEAPAIFADLHKLQKGDHLTVLGDTGATISFIVTETQVYDYDADTTDVFISSDGKARLNLITCDGVWDNATKRYPKRLVVFSERE